MNLRQQLALAAGRASSRLPPGVNGILWRILRLGTRQPIRRFTGLTHAGTEGSMLVAGNDPAAEFMPGLFFAGSPQAVEIGRAPLHRMASRLAPLRHTADLTCLRTDQWIAGLGFDDAYLRVPEWIRSSMTVPPAGAPLSRGSNSLRQDLRLIRKYGYVTVPSYDEKDLEDFYVRIFKPHTLARHGSASYLRTLDELRPLFRRGCLLFITCSGERVGGVLCSRKADRMSMAANGVLQGSGDWLRKGVLAATYAAAIERAREETCTLLDFGGTRASLTDSLLRYKRKWGARLDPRTANHHLLLTYWPSTNPAIEEMLTRAPLLFRRKRLICAVGARGAARDAFRIEGLDRTFSVAPMDARGSGGLIPAELLEPEPPEHAAAELQRELAP